MLFLPADLIPTLMSFMDADMLARMAQTCTTWKLLVYRTSVWKDLTWRPRLPQFFAQHIVCSANDIRHVGEPNKICFLAWITQLLHHPEQYPVLHPGVEHAKKPEDFVTLAQKYWRMLKKPCTITHHHKWSDVCTFRTQLHAVSPGERYKVKVLLVNQMDVSGDNGYAKWIDHRLQDLAAISTVGAPIEFTRSAILAPLLSAYGTQRNDRLAELELIKEDLVVHCEKSRKALRHYSPRTFQLMDTIVKTDCLPYYDAAAFAYTIEMTSMSKGADTLAAGIRSNES